MRERDAYQLTAKDHPYPIVQAWQMDMHAVNPAYDWYTSACSRGTALAHYAPTCQGVKDEHPSAQDMPLAADNLDCLERLQSIAMAVAIGVDAQVSETADGSRLSQARK
eukprot:352562-Chlamydomonas_euryale.AAC.7